MKSANHWVMLSIGAGIGVIATTVLSGPATSVHARPNDRFDEYVMCTGACALNPRSPSDGVWLLDHKAGKLLGTVIDRAQGRIVGWAEVDLTAEFEVAGKANTHFLMTTGNIAAGQAALYVADVTSGRIGVYTLGPDSNAANGVVIRRHDLSSFRRQGS
jgi:hypothetical protein